MNCLQPYSKASDNWSPTFFNLDVDPSEYTLSKVYHDGSHYVAVPVTNLAFERDKPRVATPMDMAFDELFLSALKEGLNDCSLKNYLSDELRKSFPDEESISSYVEAKIVQKKHNSYLRRKRFRRKAFMNPWTHFVTFTYSDELQTEESFRKRLKKLLSNFAVRRGWRCMGVFERAPETGRLHFHCLAYIPEGQMPGTIREERSYSTKLKCMQTAHVNDFFEKTFGRNDFEPIDDNAFSIKRSIDYILKYMEKTGENVVYNRHIATEIMTAVHDSNVAANLVDYVYKMVLFDDVIIEEFDVLDKGTNNILAHLPFYQRN